MTLHRRPVELPAKPEQEHALTTWWASPACQQHPPVTGESQRFISENMSGRSESGRMIDGTANGDQTAMLPLTATVRRSRRERIA